MYVCMHTKNNEGVRAIYLLTRTLAQTYINQIFESKDSTTSMNFNWTEGQIFCF